MERWKAKVTVTFEDGTSRWFPVHVLVPLATPLTDIVDALEERGWELAQEEGCPMSQCEECTTNGSEEET